MLKNYPPMTLTEFYSDNAPWNADALECDTVGYYPVYCLKCGYELDDNGQCECGDTVTIERMKG